MAILQIQNLHKGFDGVRAVDNLSFGIEENSIIALIGPNGSGKTTVFNLLSGFLKQDKGNIFFDNVEITPLSPYKIARRGMGRTFQNIRLFSQISALDNVLLAMDYGKEEGFLSALFRTKKMKEREKENCQKAEEILKFIGLTKKRDELADNLSHGQRKLLEIARVMALEPKVFLLDEPTAGLFPEIKETILNLLKDLKKRGKTILFIEHDLNSVMNVADRIIVMDSGKNIAEGKPEEIRENKEVLSLYLGKASL